MTLDSVRLRAGGRPGSDLWVVDWGFCCGPDLLRRGERNSLLAVYHKSARFLQSQNSSRRHDDASCANRFVLDLESRCELDGPHAASLLAVCADCPFRGKYLPELVQMLYRGSYRLLLEISTRTECLARLIDSGREKPASAAGYAYRRQKPVEPVVPCRLLHFRAANLRGSLSKRGSRRVALAQPRVDVWTEVQRCRRQVGKKAKVNGRSK